MTSASGVATSEAAIERPVNLLMSGPVAGVVGGIWAGRQAGYDNVITLDVGGTSADIGLAQEGRLRMKHLLDTKVGPYQAMIPMVDVDTIGAGGGSIAYVDAGGIFRVGPRSAGAVPGPAAYGRGGTEATATDAMVNLGWLLPEAFLGGGMSLDREKARTAFADGPAAALGMSVEEASMGAVQILSHSMVQSIEENSVRKGFDPRDFALVAEGGAGPLFAVPIAVEVGTPHVVVPPYPGIAAAMGLVATDMVYEYAATTYQRLSTLDAAGLQARFEELEAQAADQLAADGIEADRVVVQRIVEARYLGQGYELRVDVGSGAIDDAWVERLRADFHDIHEREYSRRFEDSDIEVPNIRVRGIGLMPELATPEVEAGDESPDAALRHEGEAWFLVDGELERGLHALLRPRGAEGGEPALRPGDRQPVRLDHRDPAGDRGPRRPVREHRDRGRRVRRGAGDRRIRNRDGTGGLTVSSLEYELGKHPGPPELERVDVDPITHARPRRRLPRDRQGDVRRPLPDVLLVDHPRVRGPRRGDLRRAGPRAVRVGLDADAHRLAPLVHPRVHAPPRGEARRGGRDHPQPPLLRRLAQPRHRRRGADLLGGRADGLRGRHRPRARRGRLVPRDQRGRVRRLRRGEDLRRAALVPGGRAERGPRQDGLRQRPHRDDEPRRHERDARRVPARARPDAAPLRALRRRHGDERRLQLDGLQRGDAARADPRSSRTASTRRRPAGSTTTRGTATSGCASRRR